MECSDHPGFSFNSCTFAQIVANLNNEEPYRRLLCGGRGRQIQYQESSWHNSGLPKYSLTHPLFDYKLSGIWMLSRTLHVLLYKIQMYQVTGTYLYLVWTGFGSSHKDVPCGHHDHATEILNPMESIMQMLTDVNLVRKGHLTIHVVTFNCKTSKGTSETGGSKCTKEWQRNWIKSA